MTPCRRILVVEDERNMRTLIRHVLTASGYIVDVVQDGLLAQDMLRKIRYAIVITDVMMPGMDGIELCIWIRDRIGLETLPVIMLSSGAQQEDRERGLEAGANDYISKPFDVSHFVDTIAAIVPKD